VANDALPTSILGDCPGYRPCLFCLTDIIEGDDSHR